MYDTLTDPFCSVRVRTWSTSVVFLETPLIGLVLILSFERKQPLGNFLSLPAWWSNKLSVHNRLSTSCFLSVLNRCLSSQIAFTYIHPCISETAMIIIIDLSCCRSVHLATHTERVLASRVIPMWRSRRAEQLRELGKIEGPNAGQEKQWQMKFVFCV